MSADEVITFRLSELPMDTLLWIESVPTIISKEDFLKSDYIADPNVMIALVVLEYAKFSLYDFIAYIGEDEMYDGWIDDVYDDIKDEPETVGFMELMNYTFAKQLTYYKGASVLMDMDVTSGRKSQALGVL